MNTRYKLHPEIDGFPIGIIKDLESWEAEKLRTALEECKKTVSIKINRNVEEQRTLVKIKCNFPTRSTLKKYKLYSNSWGKARDLKQAIEEKEKNRINIMRTTYREPENED